MAAEKTFAIRLGELPEVVREAIRQETKHYSVPLVINEIPVGSGTLVELDGHFGVLTAEHVVQHPFRPELRLTDSSHRGPRLLIPPMDSPGEIIFDSFALRVITTQRKLDAYGPDLALIILPPSGALNEIRARRSFYPLAQCSETKLADALHDTGFVAFCGFPASTQSKQGPQLGFTEVIQLYGFAFLTGPEKYEERNGWDYFELGVRRDEMGEVGDSFGGVSGGGVWRVPVYRKKDAAKGTEYFEKMFFAGVAFYEENHLPNGRFFVRAHGPRSIYEAFLPNAREQLRW
jgi:hypothetical protein